MLLTDVSREVKSIKEFLVDVVQPALHPLENIAVLQTRNEASPKSPHILPQLATRFEVSMNSICEKYQSCLLEVIHMSWLQLKVQ